MTSINSFFTSAYARQFATQLFTRNDAGAASSSHTSNTFTQNAERDGYSSASERALARISEILNGLNEDSAPATDKPSVEETNGYITSAKGTSGDDELTFKSVGLYNVDAGDGDDTLTVKSHAITDLEAGAGNDTLNLTSSSAMDISGGEGDDVINYSGQFAQNFDGGEGDDTMRVDARAILGLTGGAGNDTIEVTGERISISGGTGDDTVRITNEGDRPAVYNYAAGDGSDTIETNGPLKINFTFGYTMDDLSVSTEGSVLTVKGADGDALQVILTNGQDASDYKFGIENGVLTLSLG